MHEGLRHKLFTPVGWMWKDGWLFRIDFFFYDRAMILLQRIRSTMKKQRLKLFPRDKLRRKSSILFGYNHFQKVCLVCVCVCVFPFLNQPTTQTNP